MPVAHASPVAAQGAPATDLGPGVWMCTELAARKAGACAQAEDGYQRCAAALGETSGWDWRPLVTGIAVGLAVGVAAGAGIYASQQPPPSAAPTASTLQQR